ncbi:MAG TPA: hypothetical protein VGP82_01835 [Ktedonobacterales bacterium]|nr:hypothetical protein [Ktedonobacterales bacterium]
MPGRALEAIVVLVGVLVSSSLALVPYQATALFGVEVLAIGILSWSILALLAARVRRTLEPQYRAAHVLRSVAGQIATLPYLVAGIALFTSGLVGLYWFVAGIVFSVTCWQS